MLKSYRGSQRKVEDYWQRIQRDEYAQSVIEEMDRGLKARLDGSEQRMIQEAMADERAASRYHLLRVARIAPMRTERLGHPTTRSLARAAVRATADPLWRHHRVGH